MSRHWRWIAVLTLVAVGLVPGPHASAASLSDAGFFGRWSNGAWTVGPRLSYNQAGLASVQSAVKAGDYGLAKQKLLDYYRARPTIEAGGFSHATWPGALELTASHIWTLGHGEVYVKTVTFGPGESTVTADVTSIITSGKSGFFLMSRRKDAVIALVNSRSKGSGKPTLRVTLADGSVKTFHPSHDTYIWQANPGNVYGSKYFMQVSDQGTGPFTGETRKAYLQFDLSGVSGVKKAELTLTGQANAKKDVMLYGNAETFDEATRTWSNTVQNTFSWEGDPGGFDWKLPGGADKEYLIADMEYLYQLPRFSFAGPLALEYQKTGNEQYARTLIGLMTDFIKDADTYDAEQGADYGAGSYPGNLHAARRLHNWIAAYEILRKSPSLTPEANTAILKTMNRAGLYLQENVNGTPNKMQSQKITLLHASVYFPEFRVAPAWRTDAADFLSDQLNDSTYPDGGYKESTDGYLRGYLRQYVDVVAYMQRNGITFTATAKLRQLGRFLMDQSYPSGYGPAYGDSDSQDLRSTLGKLGELLNDPELLYVGTSGKSGEKPAHTSALYPDTRVAVSRSGWTADDSYLRINADRGNHSHPDELAITAYAYGRPLLPDMGTFTYSTDARAEWLRLTTEAHNTIEIDDHPQTSTAAGGITHLIANPAFDLIGANTEGSAGTRHERSVLSLHSGLWLVSDRLKPTNTATHRYEQNWHFASDAKPSLHPGSKAVTTAFDTGANISVVPADPGKITEALCDGSYAPQFYSVESAKYACYVKTADGQTTFDTLLLPSRGAADTSVTVERLPVGTTPSYLATALSLNGGAGVYYKSWTTKAPRTFGAYTFDGKLLYVQTGAAAESIVVVDGAVVERDGAILVKSPSPVKDLAVEIGKDGTVRVDGSSLVASVDPAKAIAIAAPQATKVVLNGASVPFKREGVLIYAVATP
ncbi:heparinase II/III family protein [Nonomuraea basaltis]|uniref:heparinase II/III family protein n=1 Tax=Nonomuraea basaltis TaxID=2495887 RepID=UPI00110C5E5D|nr:heparinase II/III family protein [Nonomuraea basaltis]TMR94439.1 DNRLRE domain-containing protein [Nonomuraea basaltis]